MVDGTDTEAVKKSLINFLKVHVRENVSWESDSNLKPLLAAIEELMSDKQPDGETFMDSVPRKKMRKIARES